MKFVSTIKDGVKKNSPYTLKPIDCQIKLNQNESPFDVPQFLKDKILTKLKKTKWNIYPDFIPDDIYIKVADYYRLSKHNLLIGNGSNEMINTILTATLESGKKVVIPTPTFTVYNLISSNLNAEIELIPLNKDFSFDVESIAMASQDVGSVTILCSPNNPTGTHLSKSQVEYIVKKSSGIVVLDEAYIHFGGESCLDLITQYDNIIILRTFSKAFGLAGLRIGFMLSNVDLIRELAKVKLPYNLNIFTLLTISEIFDNIEIVLDNIKEILKEKKFLEEKLNEIKEIEVIPSQANFFLIRVNNAKSIFDKLVENGILIRDYSSSKFLENCLRISVGTREENIKVTETLKKIFM